MVEIADFLMREYGLEVISSVPNEIGHFNKSDLVLTKEGRFFHTRYCAESIDKIVKVIDVIEFLLAKGFPVPKPVKSKEGKQVTCFDQKPAVLFTCLEGRIKYSFSKPELESVGSMLARMHLCFADYPRLEDFIEHGKDYNSTQWYDSNIAAVRELGNVESSRITKEYLLLQHQKPVNMDMNKLPLSLLHWDFKNENILFQGSKISGITDFDRIAYDNRIYDLVFCVMGFCMTGQELDREGMHAILKGYISELPLQEDELKAFPYMLKLMSWDMWTSFYIASDVRPCAGRARKPDYQDRRRAYFSIKNDKIL